MFQTSAQTMHKSSLISLIVKDSGMRVEEEKKGGKEDGSPTMPLMLFNFYRVIRSWRKGRDFFARLEYKQDGIPSCRGCGHVLSRLRAHRGCVLRPLLQEGEISVDRRADIRCNHKGASIPVSEMREYLSRAYTWLEEQQANIGEC